MGFFTEAYYMSVLAKRTFFPGRDFKAESVPDLTGRVTIRFIVTGASLSFQLFLRLDRRGLVRYRRKCRDRKGNDQGNPESANSCLWLRTDGVPVIIGSAPTQCKGLCTWRRGIETKPRRPSSASRTRQERKPSSSSWTWVAWRQSGWQRASS